MSTPHTSEPWHVNTLGIPPTIHGTGGFIAVVASGTMLELTPQTQRANADRIVACVNALAGITNPAAVPAMVEALKTCAGYFAALDQMQPDKDHGEVGTLVRRAIKAALADLESPTVGASGEPVIDWHSRFDGVREALGRVTKERDALKAALTGLYDQAPSPEWLEEYVSKARGEPVNMPKYHEAYTVAVATLHGFKYKDGKLSPCSKP